MTPEEYYVRIDGAGSSRVGPSTSTTDVDGYAVVDGDPQALADEAGLSLDAYALARMVASENGSEGAAYLLATAECAVNKASARGVSVSSLLLRGHGQADGFFSEQAAGKWASTRVDPSGRHVEAAQVAIEGSSVFSGAVDFFDPRSQDGGQQGGHTLRQSPEDYIAARATEGLAWIGDVPGINPYHLMCFARSGQRSADTGPALAALERGRSGGGAVAAGVERVATAGLGLLGVVVVIAAAWFLLPEVSP